MKLVASILLVLLVITAVAPVTCFAIVITNDGSSFLGNLDVCHSATPALSSNGEAPCVSLAFCSIVPSFSVSFTEPVHPVYSELILTSSSEHPPKS